MGKPKIIAIAAMDTKRVIGNKGKLCWHLPQDMKRFSELTKGHTVIMGRKTYDSLPEKFKPLPNRKNIVISQSLKNIPKHPEVSVCNSFLKALREIENGVIEMQGSIIWVIGGEQIYRASLQHWEEVYLTIVKGEHQGDVFFPDFESDFIESTREDREGFSYVNYVHK